MTEWEIEGRELVNCNCAYGCPCQFNALPTHGNCEAAATFAIDRGHYGDVQLDGLRAAFVVQWPGPIHEGHGRCQPVVDAQADPAQREALLKIILGHDTDPGATVYAVFATTYDEVFEPIVADMDVEVDVDARRGRIRVGTVYETDGEPIHNPITGQEHRARIDLPNGFEFEIAEVGSGTTRSHGKVELELTNTYAQFARLHMNNHGPIRRRHA
ncbi:MAG TPA: DUF1326 domain-containing protein [Rhodanobacteraceae bacterium]|nr:DUF1326 domain-containing protein [Rhodanobacteraceae bacterium]